jgi:hypothetical protein
VGDSAQSLANRISSPLKILTTVKPSQQAQSLGTLLDSQTLHHQRTKVFQPKLVPRTKLRLETRKPLTGLLLEIKMEWSWMREEGPC